MKADSRTRLSQAAEKTTDLYGFGSTSIADIAKEAGVPLGNVYYYFKTKDDIGGAIVEPHVSRFKKLLQELDSVNSPKEPLYADL
jgi:AcrR family transcriptional regulator